MKKYLLSFIVLSVILSAILLASACNNSAELEKLKAQQQEEIDLIVASQLSSLRVSLDSACHAQFDAVLNFRVDSLLAAADAKKAGSLIQRLNQIPLLPTLSLKPLTKK